MCIKRPHPISYQLLRQTHSQYDTQLWKAERLPAKIWNKSSMPTLTMSIQHSKGRPSHGNQRRKKKKRKKYNQIIRREVKLSLYADDMIYV